jgi:hypothetical protein
MTRQHLEKQQFESTFFNMLGMINTLGNNVHLNDQVKGWNYYNEFINKLKSYDFKNWSYHHNYYLRNDLSNMISNKYPDDINFKYNQIDIKRLTNDKPNVKDEILLAWIHEHEEEYIGFLYDIVFEEMQSQLAHVFRYVFRTMKLAIESRGDYKDENKYIGLIQSQLSNYQLAVMFYSGLSEQSLDKNGYPQFKEWADEYQLFQNIHPTFLIDR